MEVRASKDPGVGLTSSLVDYSVHRKLIDPRRSLSTIDQVVLHLGSQLVTTKANTQVIHFSQVSLQIQAIKHICHFTLNQELVHKWFTQILKLIKQTTKQVQTSNPTLHRHRQGNQLNMIVKTIKFTIDIIESNNKQKNKKLINCIE